jgi:hypothetical protein
MNMQQKRFLALIAYQMLSIAGIASLSMAAAYADDGEGAFLPRLVVSSTVPANGDLNPYGATAWLSCLRVFQQADRSRPATF